MANTQIFISQFSSVFTQIISRDSSQAVQRTPHATFTLSLSRCPCVLIIAVSLIYTSTVFKGGVGSDQCKVFRLILSFYSPYWKRVNSVCVSAPHLTNTLFVERRNTADDSILNATFESFLNGRIVNTVYHTTCRTSKTRQHAQLVIEVAINPCLLFCHYKRSVKPIEFKLDGCLNSGVKWHAKQSA